MKRLSKLLVAVMCTLWVFAIFQNSYGQEPITWSRTYEDMYGRQVEQTSDGRYVFLASKFSRDVAYGLLIKVDIDGNTEWTKTVDQSSPYPETALIHTKDGGFAIAISSYFDQSTRLIKTDVNGDTIWTKNYGEDLGAIIFCFEQTTEGGFIFGGQKSSVPHENWLCKTDSLGDVLWVKKNAAFFPNEIRQIPEGGFIMIGSIRKSINQPTHPGLSKIGANGEDIWTKTYSSMGPGRGLGVEQTADGGYILLGSVDPSGWILIKTDARGDTIWTNTYTWNTHQSVQPVSDVEQTDDGGYIVLGNIEPHGWILSKTDDSGDTIWTKTYNSMGPERVSNVEQTADGGYIIIGISQDSTATMGWLSTTWLIKTDSNGNVNTTSSGESQYESIINIYPNPADDLLTIEANLSDHYSINIASLSGQQLFSRQVEGTSYQIDLSSFQEGVYFITIRSKDFVATKKIIKY